MSVKSSRYASPAVRALAVPTVICLGFFGYDAWHSRSVEYWYLVWNLFLAALPLLFAGLLVRRLRKTAWSSWTNIGLSLLWLGFLPNSFYIFTNFIHLQDIVQNNSLYYVVMFAAFSLTGFLYGYLSTFLIHTELVRRRSKVAAGRYLATVFLLCSFAIYIGRDLRWNTWDVLLKPGGLLFDVSDRLLHPSGYPDMFTTTAIFFVLISAFYYAVWQLYQTSPWSQRQ